MIKQTEMCLRNFLLLFIFFIAFDVTALAQKKKGKSQPVTQQIESGKTDRLFWLAQMDKMVKPVLYNLANDSLRVNMPQIVSIRSDNPDNRKKVAYLEVFSRTLCGIAPWLQLEGGSAEEGRHGLISHDG